MGQFQRGQGVHFVGTIPLADAEQVFRTTTELLGDRLRRLPDGETTRSGWVASQVPVLARHPDIVHVVVDVPGHGERPFFRPRPGLDAAALDLGDIGYAGYARDSYALFSRLRSEGVIPRGVRFQVNLPTPLAIASITAQPDVAPVLEAAYQRALLRELAQILETIPPSDLAVQWDIAIELLMIEGVALTPPWFDDVWGGVLERIARLSAPVLEAIELGLHLWYGDFQHRRLVDLDDASVLVELANRLVGAIGRHVDFVHLPVRGDVDPATYLAPLSGLRLEDNTELYLGLITDDGGAEGASARIAAARRHVDTFGVATECGMGRRPPEAVLPLLRVHRAVSSPLSSATVADAP